MTGKVHVTSRSQTQCQQITQHSMSAVSSWLAFNNTYNTAKNSPKNCSKRMLGLHVVVLLHPIKCGHVGWAQGVTLHCWNVVLRCRVHSSWVLYILNCMSVIAYMEVSVSQAFPDTHYEQESVCEGSELAARRHRTFTTWDWLVCMFADQWEQPVAACT